MSEISKLIELQMLQYGSNFQFVNTTDLVEFDEPVIVIQPLETINIEILETEDGTDVTDKYHIYAEDIKGNPIMGFIDSPIKILQLNSGSCMVYKRKL